MLGPDATPSQIDATRKGLGLDRPVYEQLLGFYARILRGDLGQSYFVDRPVSQALWERVEPTLVLMHSALVVAIAIGVPSGTIAAAHRESAWDRALMLVSLLGVPPYVPSWGNVIASGKNVIREAFWVSLFPGVALTLAGLSLNLLGDGLRDLLDPRLRVQ